MVRLHFYNLLLSPGSFPLYTLLFYLVVTASYRQAILENPAYKLAIMFIYLEKAFFDLKCITKPFYFLECTQTFQSPCLF